MDLYSADCLVDCSVYQMVASSVLHSGPVSVEKKVTEMALQMVYYLVDQMVVSMALYWADN